MNLSKHIHIKGLFSLSPLAVFLAVYLVSSVISGDFYSVPVSAAFLIASVYALSVTGKGTVHERIDLFSSGAGDRNVLLMVWIFVLAGAFARTAEDIGAVDATVGLTLKLIPGKMLFAGFFLMACFISFAIGTSVGTIVALVPIASGISQETGLDMAFLTGVIVGGAFFGDNLSFISDTTIASTRAAGCEMRDKFKANVRIVLPAVIISLVLYLMKGSSVDICSDMFVSKPFKLIPYLVVISLALCGVDVSLVLISGIVTNALIGLFSGPGAWKSFLVSMGTGVAGMGDLIIVTLLAGGMLAVISGNGGLDYITGLLTRGVKGGRGAQLSIAAFVSLANLCTANNTIAIIVTGRIARSIGERFGVPPQRTASILDTFSCVVQSLIPYGAQILMASTLSGLSPMAIIPKLYYPMFLALASFLAILFVPVRQENN